VAVHVSVRERSPTSPATPKTPTVHYPLSPVRQAPSSPLQPPNTPSTPNGSSSDDAAAADMHFHAVTVGEREFTEFQAIFDRKKGPDGRIACSTVRMVLQSYWRFIHREGFAECPAGERLVFPQQRLNELQQKVGATPDGGMTLDQFLTVFYLFDNSTSNEPCIHGERERVRMACAQLHSCIQPQREFYHDRFEELFLLVCSDENSHTLTCKEMELLYYMYSGHVLARVREEELVARVQAIVRMRIEASRYKQLQEAARTLQSAWRMRAFAHDRTNHERIADFLRTMMMSSASKVGGPRNF
jgi:hypothetical protein